MSRSSLPVLALTGQPQTLPLPAQMSGLQVRLANESAYTLIWTWGTQSGVLYPSEVDVLKPDATSIPSIQLLPVSGVLPPALALTSNLVAELAFPPDGFVGQYPQQMARLSQTAVNKVKLYPVGATPVGPSLVTAANASASGVFNLPAGTVAVRVMATAGGLVFSWGLNVTGNTTSVQYLGSNTTPGSTLPMPQPEEPVTVPVEFDWDSSVSIDVQGDPTVSVNYFVSAMLDVEAPGQTNASSAVFSPVAAPWQAPQATGQLAVGSLAAGNSIVLVAALPKNDTFLHQVAVHIIGVGGSFCTLETTAGGGLRGIDTSVTSELEFDFKGMDIGTNVGLRLRNNSGVATGALNGGADYAYGQP